MPTSVRFALLFILWASALTLRAADHLTLTSGLDIEGQIICDSPTNNPLVAIAIDGKVLAFNRSEISSITQDDDGRADYAKQRDAIKGKNAQAHFELYQWSRSKHFFDYANQELSLTLKCDPNHAQARQIAFAPAKLSKPSAAKDAANGAPPAENDTLVIGLRPTVRLQTAYEEKIIAYCTTLLQAATNDDTVRKNALAALTNDRVKASETLVALIDPARDTDEQTRLAVLAGIDALKPNGIEVSMRLAQAAIADRYAPVRTQTQKLIKSRNDEYAMNAMVNAYVSAFGESGSVRDPLLKAAAGAALKGLEEKRIGGALFYRATCEVRTAVSELNNLATRQIDSFTVNQGANVAVVVPLSFPIQFPELAITSVKTTVCAPCSALSDFTGQNFGNDLDAWAKWLRMQK